MRTTFGKLVDDYKELMNDYKQLMDENEELMKENKKLRKYQEMTKPFIQKFAETKFPNIAKTNNTNDNDDISGTIYCMT